MAPFVVSIFYDRARLYHMLLLISQGYTRARANAWLGEKERNVSVVAEYGGEGTFRFIISYRGFMSNVRFHGLENVPV